MTTIPIEASPAEFGGNQSGFESGFEFPSQENDIEGASGGSPEPKRNKIDKDGFLTPSTPDIPRTSMFFQSKEGVDEYDENRVTDYQTDGQTDFQIDTDRGEEGEEDVQQDHNIGAATKDLDETEPTVPFDQLFKEFEEQTKSLHATWSGSFKESEAFEDFCLTRINKLLQDAKALEKNLMEQKQQLTQRLQGLSRTLQQM